MVVFLQQFEYVMVTKGLVVNVSECITALWLKRTLNLLGTSTGLSTTTKKERKRTFEFTQDSFMDIPVATFD